MRNGYCDTTIKMTAGPVNLQQSRPDPSHLLHRDGHITPVSEHLIDLRAAARWALPSSTRAWAPPSCFGDLEGKLCPTSFTPRKGHDRRPPILWAAMSTSGVEFSDLGARRYCDRS